MSEFSVSSSAAEFPNSLPGIPGITAFGVKLTELHKDMTVNSFDTNGMWQHNACVLNEIHNVSLRSLIQEMRIELPIFGQFAKCNPLTLDAAAKRSASIPEDADHFCWGNPMAITDENKRRIGELDPSIISNPDVSFLLYGGFMYFCNGELIRCNSLAPSNEGLLFGPPIKFNRIEHQSVQIELAKAGRFQEVTIETYRSRGAKYFCWVLPGEFNLCENGGFIYLFDEDMHVKHEDNRYFKVLGQDEFESRSKEVTDLFQSGEFSQVQQQQHFGLAGMSSEQLAQLQAFVSDRRTQLDDLLDQRQLQEGGGNPASDFERWSTVQCIAKLTEVGANYQLVQAFQQFNLKGSDLKFLWAMVDAMTAGSNPGGEGSNDADLSARIQQLQMELESTQLCCVCLSEQREILITPCNHIPACSSCTANLRICPICRQRKRSTRRVHI